ncbi:hypothetical protein IWW39_003394 [Coemansia spiralis]|uniref:Uncharacterized protein n=1 Tax=Coemansia spiralis TaxID=417178 RepID=A0A9W8GJ62_9FUNG|nr:hypothetical protein IWW39_003394 [Coemansia spiralis]
MTGVPIVNTVDELQRLILAAPNQVHDIYVIPYFNYLDRNAQTEAQALCEWQNHPLCIFTGEFDGANMATHAVDNFQLRTLTFNGPLQFYEYLEHKRMSHKLNVPIG